MASPLEIVERPIAFMPTTKIEIEDQKRIDLEILEIIQNKHDLNFIQRYRELLQSWWQNKWTSSTFEYLQSGCKSEFLEREKLVRDIYTTYFELEKPEIITPSAFLFSFEKPNETK